MKDCQPFTHMACNALQSVVLAGTKKGRLLLFDVERHCVLADFGVENGVFHDG